MRFPPADLSPPHPPLPLRAPCCASCGASGPAPPDSGQWPVFAAVDVLDQAVERAVARAFAELQPALLRAVSVATSASADSSADSVRVANTGERLFRPRRLTAKFANPRAGTKSDSGCLCEETTREEETEQPSGVLLTSRSFGARSTPPDRNRTEPLQEGSEAPTEYSVVSSRAPTSRQSSAARPLTVQAMHSTVAQSVLEESGFDFSRRRASVISRAEFARVLPSHEAQAPCVVHDESTRRAEAEGDGAVAHNSTGSDETLGDLEDSWESGKGGLGCTSTLDPEGRHCY